MSNEQKEVIADAVVLGQSLFLADSPEAEGRSDDLEEYNLAMVIQFKSQDEMREAMLTRKIKLSVFGDLLESQDEQRT